MTVAPTGASHVLVVDDDELITELLAESLRARGHGVSVAATGAEALDVLAERGADLVVSDVNMPDLNGFELLRLLRGDPGTRWLPVMLLTSRTDSSDVVHGLSLGADDYISKPFRLEEVVARIEGRLARPPVPLEDLRVDSSTGLLAREQLDEELRREFGRFTRGGAEGCVAVIGLAELEGIEVRLGATASDAALREVASLLLASLSPLDLVGRIDNTHVGVLLPETAPADARRRLEQATARIAGATLPVGRERLRATPSTGFIPFDDADSAEQLLARARVALDYATAHLDLVPLQWQHRMDKDVERQRAEAERLRHGETVGTLWRRVRTPVQVALTFVLGVVLPYLAYAALDERGIDVTPFMYVVVVVTLAVTGGLITLEGMLSVRVADPPEEPGEPYPPASAVIAAYLPNEAATIIETLEAFLRVSYPAGLQVVLAYNTPEPMAVETLLHDLADRHERLTVVRVEGSTSKAQNVNAALAQITGRFVGVFDADHHPDPDSFRRAWRWLSNGYDVVQGHCLARNGDASFVARMVAVEFEAIYGVAHPGRARMHGFGIFGGSNGYWRTDLLHEVRMRGSMLTEDIDSSLRVLESGGRVRSDPRLVSRELATTTLRQVWNQRMRWAQGWFQVSLEHLWRGLRSRDLTLRQKLGLVHLLAWRELYPWVSLQMFPIIAFWLVRGDPIDWVVPIFVLTTLFTTSVGPLQTWFAYRNADPQIKQHRRWFWQFLLFSSPFYTEYKNLIARTAQVKEAMGERDWRVTPRSADAETAQEA